MRNRKEGQGETPRPRDIWTFIREHEFEDESKLLLKYKSVLNFPMSWVACQISGRRKAKSKLPTWYANPGIEYPPSINIEQCSSEVTARCKIELIKQEISRFKRAADLTGGFGVDSFFLSRLFENVDHVEPDNQLLEIVIRNHAHLGAGKSLHYHNCTAETFIAGAGKKYDLIYVDPSRRTKAHQKVVKLGDCTPNVVSLLPRLFEISNCVLIKCSPLLDLQLGVKELKSVAVVSVIAVDNECKEVLFLCKKGLTHESTVQALNITNSLNLKPIRPFTFRYSEEALSKPEYSPPLDLLYEPNAAIMKAGAFKLVSTYFGLKKIQPNTHLYTSKELILDFPGRIFKIEALVKPEPKKLKQYFSKGQANVITRNYPLTADQLRKKTGLKDGGENFLIGFSGQSEKFLAVGSRVARDTVTKS